MADDQDTDKQSEIVRFSASAQLWNYLGWLSKNTLLGKTENEVARQVLTDKLTQMRQEEYRDDKRS